MVLWKGKGDPSLPDSFRGILFADHLAKVITALLQEHISPTYAAAVGPAQHGAVKGRGTAQAPLLPRSFLGAASLLSLSVVCLFVDLSKAFDLAIREVVVGWMPGMLHAPRSEKISLLTKLGADPFQVDRLVSWIDGT